MGEKPDIIIYTDGAASDNGKKNATAGIRVSFADFRTNAEEQLGQFNGVWWKKGRGEGGNWRRKRGGGVFSVKCWVLIQCRHNSQLVFYK